jgi:RNA polymerase sigma factor (sigma-70 family)
MTDRVSDTRLLLRFRAGDDEAFAVLHDRYRPRLSAYAARMLRSATPQDVEDVLQDVFMRAYHALRGDAREIHVRAWLYRVAHNRCLDHLCRRQPPPPAEVLAASRTPTRDPVEETFRREQLRELVGGIDRLPGRQRSAVVMRELDGMSYVEIAASLDATVAAVKSLLARARTELATAAAPA